MPVKSLKEKMIEEAFKIINKEGFDNFSVRILSKRLNVSHNAMYKHFPSKTELLFEVIKLGFNKLSSALIEINERTDIDELAKLREIFYVYFEFALENPDVYRLMYNFYLVDNEFPEDIMDTYKINYQTAYKTVENAVQAGKLKKASVYSMANTAWAFAHGMSLLLIDNIIPMMKNIDSPPQLMIDRAKGKKDPVRDVVKYSIDVIINGLAPKNRSYFS